MHLTQVGSEFAPEIYPRIDVSVGGDPKSQVISGAPIDDSRGFSTYLAGDRDVLDRARGQRPHQGAGRESNGFHGRVVPLVDLIAGVARGRLQADEISSSAGSRSGGGKQGLQFVTVASLVYDQAKAAGLGREVPTEWFLQDIRD
ncbi:MAG: ocd2 [Chloroflexi bacterium]|nr:ocd2 [Chloroflexota bacterium]